MKIRKSNQHHQSIFMAEDIYQKFISFTKQDKKSWTSRLFNLVEKKFDKFVTQIHDSKIPVSINYSESLVHFYHNVLVTINLAGIEKNPYMAMSLSKTNRVNVKLKKNTINELMEFMLFTGNTILGNEQLEINMNKLIRIADKGNKFIRTQSQSIIEENIAIIKIREELTERFGRGHKSSLKKAVTVYSQRHNQHWSEKEIDNKTEALRQRPPK